ncbi:hypothetical protein PQR67_33745, partial [Paraburkholderia fungorum]|uniref:hypothetical protein n=1 Tax=Paraburkholderia fungorum TaxID=134537 RepID=UPI0038B6CF0F
MGEFDQPFTAVRVRGGLICDRQQCVQLVAAVAGGAPFFYESFDRVEHFLGFLPAALGCVPTVLAFPCFLSGLLALPLCGAAPTFLCLP